MNFYRRFPYTNLNDINLDWIIKKIKALIGVVDEKQDKPATTGTAGQVLGLDENLNPVWLDQTGGGGGTNNYNSLINKPQIESITLLGNKTAVELGLARASDVPTKTSDLTNDSGFVNASEAAAAAPVQSVNGLSGGDVVIAIPSASSALPQMDGVASAGSNFSNFARGDHVHPTDISRAAAAELATYVRPNLLVNGYFVGGGSQLGYGKLPINQRGQTTYSGSGYCIDRFRSDYSTKVLSSDGLTVTRTGSGTWALIQDVSAPAVLGKTITFSALIKDYAGNIRLQISWFEGSTQRQVYKEITNVGVISVTLTVPSAASNISAIVWIGAENDWVKLTAVKLEVGTTQTLAHQENGVWVLNEIPNFNEERQKCYAYFYKPGGIINAYGFVTAGATQYYIVIPVPVPMAKAPVLIGSRTWLARGASGYSEATPITSAMTNTSVAFAVGSTITLKETLSETAGDVNNSLFVYEISGLALSAE